MTAISNLDVSEKVNFILSIAKSNKEAAKTKHLFFPNYIYNHIWDIKGTLTIFTFSKRPY